VYQLATKNKQRSMGFTNQ